jgi:hypothetical protein
LESPRWYPPFYTHGPFRAFLATAETEAVTAILQLIEHATDRWAESRTRDQVEEPIVLIQVDGKAREYVGDADVFAWGWHGPDLGYVIQVALMALEKHLYDQVDGGADVTSLVQRLLTESRSLAIVGLLSVFGRRYLHYLRGPLRGLLVSPYVLHWTLMGGAAGVRDASLLPKPLKEEYRVWHEMPHRKRSMRDCALFLFLNDDSLRSFFGNARRDLQKNLLPGGLYQYWPLVEHFVAQLDSGNYTKNEGEGGTIYLSYCPPQELEQKYPMPEEKGGLFLLLLVLECRRLLDGELFVAPGILDQLWESAQRLSEMGFVDDRLQPEDGLAGIAAVFVQRGGEWLSGHPDRAEWARLTLLGVACKDESLPATGVQYDRWTFASEALPALWADNPGDIKVREVVARLALYAPPNLVGTLTERVASVRLRLGEDHVRLIRVVLLRAGLQYRIHQAKRAATKSEEWSEGKFVEEAIKAFRDERDALRVAFLTGTLKAAIPGLDEIAPLVPLGRHYTNRRQGRRRISHRPIEESLLAAAYRGVPAPGDDKGFWLPVWERIVLDTICPLAPDNQEAEDLEDHSGEWRDFFGARVAGAVAATGPAAAENLWKPIINLGGSASRWVASFVHHWTAYALYRDARGSVLESWMAMIDSALTNPFWRANRCTGELWRALLGLDRFGSEVWVAELQPRVRLLRTRLAVWVESHLGNADNTRAFAHFLEQPAAAELTFDGLNWLDQEAQKLGDSFWGWKGQRDRADSAVFSLLVYVWGPNREMLRRNGIAFSAFRNLLQTLVSRQHAPALELADRVGSVF